MSETAIADDGRSLSDTVILDSATTTDLNRIENALDTRQDQAFSSLIHIVHMPPPIANALSSAYRAALSSNTMVQRFAKTNGWDTAWLYFAGATLAYLGLSAAEIGMALMEKVIGMSKWVLFVPMVGIPLWRLGRRKSLKEILEFLGEERKEGGDEVREFNHES